MSQEELAERVGVSRQTLSKYETGESVPDIDKAMAIADAVKAKYGFTVMNANQFYLAGNLLVYALTVVMSCRRV